MQAVRKPAQLGQEQLPGILGAPGLQAGRFLGDLPLLNPIKMFIKKLSSVFFFFWWAGARILVLKNNMEHF